MRIDKDSIVYGLFLIIISVLLCRVHNITKIQKNKYKKLNTIMKVMGCIPNYIMIKQLKV